MMESKGTGYLSCRPFRYVTHYVSGGFQYMYCTKDMSTVFHSSYCAVSVS